MRARRFPSQGRAPCPLARTQRPLSRGRLERAEANYFRDPTKLNSTSYKQYSQLAQWNGEGVNGSLPADKARWAKTSKFVWVRGTLDTVVWPNAGEQWGAVGDDYPKNLTSVPMKQTRWYLEDPFGLRTADEAGKNAFEEFQGEHIRFTMDELDGARTLQPGSLVRPARALTC